MHLVDNFSTICFKKIVNFFFFYQEWRQISGYVENKAGHLKEAITYSEILSQEKFLADQCLHTQSLSADPPNKPIHLRVRSCDKCLNIHNESN